MQKEPSPNTKATEVLDEIEKRYGVDRSLFHKLTDALSGRSHAIRQEDARRDYPEAMGGETPENPERTPKNPRKNEGSSGPDI